MQCVTKHMYDTTDLWGELDEHDYVTIITLITMLSHVTNFLMSIPHTCKLKLNAPKMF